MKRIIVKIAGLIYSLSAVFAGFVLILCACIDDAAPEAIGTAFLIMIACAVWIAIYFFARGIDPEEIRKQVKKNRKARENRKRAKALSRKLMRIA